MAKSRFTFAGDTSFIVFGPMKAAADHWASRAAASRFTSASRLRWAFSVIRVPFRSRPLAAP